MPLKVPHPPEAALGVIADAMRNMSEGAPEAMRAMTIAAAEPEEIDASVPHQVYSLGLDAVQAADLKAAKLLGWRYLMMRGERVIAAAEVDAPGGGTARRGRLNFSHFNEGPFVQASVQALAQAEELEEVADGEYEVRVLKIAALYVFALWLHSDDKDLLLPMPPTHESLVANQVYTASEFFKLLSSAAKTRLAFDDTPKPPKPAKKAQRRNVKKKK